MGILSSIKEKLFGKAAAEPAKSTTAAQTAAAPAITAASVAAAATAASKLSGATPASVVAATTAAAGLPVDVETVIEKMAKENNFKGNWRVSIVDFLNALGLDSSMAARKELAKDLNYTGSDADGSAEKNTWLLKTLMKTLAESGGKLPKDLLK